MNQGFDRGNVAAPDKYCKLPGLVDVHIHLREPGFLYKETIKTGTAAAAAGGFTAVCPMPNVDPCPDCRDNLDLQFQAIRRDAIVPAYPYAAITVGENGEQLAELEDLTDAVSFSDDGRGVMSDELLEQAMIRAKALGKIITAHCEDERFPRESSEAEWMQLKRDLDLVRKTGCRYHMCHISTKESVELIRGAKAEGLDVTCETAPHYLLLNSDDVRAAKEHDQAPGRFKMNPPIKDEEDRLAIIGGIQDGTIDMIATDHAPHSAAEKAGPFDRCAFGIVGLETAFPVLYTGLVLEGVITLDKLVRLMSFNPAERFGIRQDTGNTFTLWDLDEEYTIDPETFRSKGRSTPFEGWRVRGRCMKTVVNGKEVYSFE